MHLKEDHIIGFHKWKGDLDLLNIIIIGIAKSLPKKEEKYELHRLLSALLSSDLEVEDKLDIMEEEYDIPLENDIRNDDSSVRLEYKAFYIICFVKTFCGNIYTIKLHEYIIYTGVPNEKQSSEKRNALGEA